MAIAAWRTRQPGSGGIQTVHVGLAEMVVRRGLALGLSIVEPVCAHCAVDVHVRVGPEPWLVFEDLHWIDEQTQALLTHLIESLPTARLLLLVNYRPEYQHGWGSKTSYTQLRLDPLPPVSAHEFLHALLGNYPSLEALKQLLIARTEGNPFFLEESVRTWLADKTHQLKSMSYP